MPHRSIIYLLAFLTLAPRVRAQGDESQLKNLVEKARSAYESGKKEEALVLLGKAIASEPKSPQGYLVRGQIRQATGEHEQAIADYNEALKLEPRAAEVYQRRGTEHFKLGQIADSIADFDKYIELRPREAPHHWQRGISLYYAGRYNEGRKQFESHQTVNRHDVENAVWHFLCVARSEGLEKARSSLIPITDDARVPMKEVHALFAGMAKPEDVLVAAKAGNSPAAGLAQQLFYAHLYLGLYFEATQNEKLAREYIFKAADQAAANGYMGDVARVHAQLLRKEIK